MVVPPFPVAVTGDIPPTCFSTTMTILLFFFLPFIFFKFFLTGFINLVEQVRPTQCTLVPDSNDQLTSDHGWNFDEITFDFQQLVDRLKSQGIRTSAFLDTDYHQINLAKKMGLECVELYTGPYANSFGGDMQIENLGKLVSASEKCINLGLVVNAGHDLNQQNLPLFVQQVPEVREVSVGHALICDSIYQGLEQTVKNYKSILIEHSKGLK